MDNKNEFVKECDNTDVESVDDDADNNIYLKNRAFPEHYNIFEHIKKYMDYSYETYDETDNSLYVDEDLLNIEDCKKVIMRTCKRTLDNGL